MKANRLAGHYAKTTPATQVIGIIHHIAKALSEILRENATTDQVSHLDYVMK